MIILLPLLVVLIGILVYLLSTNPKYVELGRIMFACGVLGFLLNPTPVISFLSGGNAVDTRRVN